MAERFSPEDRAAAVARALSGDETKRQVAADVGVSETTLFRWINAAAEDRPKVAHLRVAPDPAPTERRLKVGEAAATGNRRQLLVAMRDRLAKAVEDVNTPARDLAALSRRLLEVANELEAIDSSEGDDDIGKAARTPDDEWDESAV